MVSRNWLLYIPGSGIVIRVKDIADNMPGWKNQHDTILGQSLTDDQSLTRVWH